MSLPNIIAIDGPAASGKSTLGRRLADSLGYLFFDTGVMYRAVTWVTLQHGVEVQDEPAVTHLAETVQIDVLPPSKEDGRACDVLADGVDITWETRTPEWKPMFPRFQPTVGCVRRWPPNSAASACAGGLSWWGAILARLSCRRPI